MEIVANFGVHDKCLALFHDDSRQAGMAYEEARQGLLDVYARIYRGLVSEAVDVAYFRSGANLVIFSRSLREGVAVQRSVFWDRDGEYIALSHQDIRSEKDMGEYAADGVTICIE